MENYSGRFLAMEYRGVKSRWKMRNGRVSTGIFLISHFFSLVEKRFGGLYWGRVNEWWQKNF